MADKIWEPYDKSGARVQLVRYAARHDVNARSLSHQLPGVFCFHVVSERNSLSVRKQAPCLQEMDGSRPMNGVSDDSQAPH
jgi:hypothetical protein